MKWEHATLNIKDFRENINYKNINIGNWELYAIHKGVAYFRKEIEKAMNKWEYIHVLETADIGYFNDLGDQGWELICRFGGINNDIYYIFKRPKQEMAKSEKEIRQAVEGYVGGKIG